jgi:hypothetical protein
VRVTMAFMVGGPCSDCFPRMLSRGKLMFTG